MTTHTPKKKAAPKQAAATSGPSDATTAEVKTQTTDWGDRNPELRRRYISAEQQLARASKRSDRRRTRLAKKELEAIGREFVELNRGLIISQARRFNRNVHEDQDNVSAATLGLWEAFKRFDPDRGVAFSTFSRQHISGGLQREVRRNEFQHLSQSEFNLRKQIRLAQSQLAATMGRQPTREELAAKTGIPLDKVEKVLSPALGSLDAVVGDDGFTLGDRLEAVIHDTDEGDGLEPYLSEVSDLELWVLLQRGGFLGANGISLVEAADGIGIGREVARRAESRARVRVATTVIADRLGRLAKPAEVANLMSTDVEHVVEYASSPWEDLAARYARCRKVRVSAITYDDQDNAQERLDRCGEEFMLNASTLIAEAAGRYLDAEGTPIGVDLAAREVWLAFAGWDLRVTTFPMHLRATLTQSYRRARNSRPHDVGSAKDLWSMVSDSKSSI
jgi:RNA polymerase sigma factor (sigma-70 family)